MAGSRSLGTLTVDLVAKIGGFTQGMDKAERELDSRAKKLNATAKKIGIGIGTAISAGLAAGTTIAAGLKLSIDRMDELSKAAQKVSLPTEQFSQLAYAGELADVSVQDLESSLARLTKAQAEANNETSKQAKLFDALGVSTKNADGTLRSSIDVLYDFADRFKELQGSPEATAAGLELFGRSFQNIIPLIKDGSQGLRDAAEEADALGITLGTTAGNQAEEFNDNITRLTTSIKGMWQGLATELLPTLVQVSGEFVDYIKNSDDAKQFTAELADGIRDFARAMADLANTGSHIIGFLEDLRNGLNTVQAALNGLNGASAKAGGSGLFGVGDALRKRFPWLYKSPGSGPDAVPSPRFDVVGGSGSTEDGRTNADALRRINAAYQATKKSGGKAQKSDAEREAEQLEKAYQRLMETQQQEIALFGKTGEAAKLRYEIEHGELVSLTEAKKQELLANAERIDQMNEEADLAKKLAAEDERRFDSFTDVMGGIKDQTELLGMSADQQEIWNNLKWAGVTADSEWGKQIIESTRSLQEQRDALEDQIELMDGARDAGRTFFDSLRDGEGIVNSLKDAFGKFADALYDWATNSLIEQFFGKQGTSGSGTQAGGWISALFGSGGGSSQGSLIDLFSGAWGYAGGGTIGANTVARVNERGFEMASVGGSDYMLTGNRPVDITPNHRLGSGGSVTQIFNNPIMSNAQTEFQKAAEEARKAQRAVARS